MRRQSSQRLAIVLADGLGREEVGKVMVRVHSKEDVGYIGLATDVWACIGGRARYGGKRGGTEN